MQISENASSNKFKMIRYFRFEQEITITEKKIKKIYLFVTTVLVFSSNMIKFLNH